MVGLQKMLHEKLQKMPISIEEQKRLIRYLVNLDAPYEPAWDAIQSHSDYINLRFKQCYEDHKAAESALSEELSNFIFLYIISYLNLVHLNLFFMCHSFFLYHTLFSIIFVHVKSVKKGSISCDYY